jgi:hypothetical protein
MENATEDIELPAPQYAERISPEEYNRQKDEYTKRSLADLNLHIKAQQFKAGRNSSKGGPLTRNSIAGNCSQDSDDSCENDNSDDGDGDYRDNSDNSDNSDNIKGNSVRSTYGKVPKVVIQHVVDVLPVTKSTKAPTKTPAKVTKADKREDYTTTADNTTAIDGNALVALIEQNDAAIKTITEQKRVIKRLNEEINDLERRLHFMKLELSNSQIELNSANDELKAVRADIAKYKDNKVKMEGDLRYYEKLVVFMKCIIVVLFLMNIFY